MDFVRTFGILTFLALSFLSVADTIDGLEGPGSFRHINKKKYEDGHLTSDKLYQDLLDKNEEVILKTLERAGVSKYVLIDVDDSDMSANVTRVTEHLGNDVPYWYSYDTEYRGSMTLFLLSPESGNISIADGGALFSERATLSINFDSLAQESFKSLVTKFPSKLISPRINIDPFLSSLSDEAFVGISNIFELNKNEWTKSKKNNPRLSFSIKIPSLLHIGINEDVSRGKLVRKMRKTNFKIFCTSLMRRILLEKNH